MTPARSLAASSVRPSVVTRKIGRSIVMKVERLDTSKMYRGTNPEDSQDSREFLWIPGDSKGFLKICRGFRGFSGIPRSEKQGVPKDSVGFRQNPCGLPWILQVSMKTLRGFWSVEHVDESRNGAPEKRMTRPEYYGKINGCVMT